MDLMAAQRWARRALQTSQGEGHSPWLHEEIARRMQERLAFIKLQPSCWAAWEPVRSGLAALKLIQERYSQAQCLAVVAHPQERRRAEQALQAPWWRMSRWIRPVVFSSEPPESSVQMLWANMLLHQSADPQALIAQWHRALAVDGFVMFSCLGPDTLRELRAAYAVQGWQPPAHEFTDMHDWGDMLVQAGFAEPVMDMERITLTYESPERLLSELRELGRNFSIHRFTGLRGRHWHAQLLKALSTLARPDQEGRLVLTFEVVYGHALKPQPRAKVQAVSEIGLEDMRAMLRKNPKI
jgi:malonyl-CoA O-methyltransferase